MDIYNFKVRILSQSFDGCPGFTAQQELDKICKEKSIKYIACRKYKDSDLEAAVFGFTREPTEEEKYIIHYYCDFMHIRKVQSD